MGREGNGEATALAVVEEEEEEERDLEIQSIAPGEGEIKKGKKRRLTAPSFFLEPGLPVCVGQPSPGKGGGTEEWGQEVEQRRRKTQSLETRLLLYTVFPEHAVFG